MSDIVKRALTAKRESKHVEFKQGFDPNSARGWCELVKDLAAIANSGGGIIIFGLDNYGTPTGESIEAITSIDPADIANKVSRYTGLVDFEFDIRTLEKKGNKLVAFVIQPVSIPLVFEKPGTYDIGGGEQRTAFSVGTVYFRHGAKSEPGTSDDIRRVIERQLEYIRKSWVKGVKKVVQAPAGSQIVTVQSASRSAHPLLATQVRAVNDPNAIAVRLTRDSALASGSFVHEEVSDALFDEINNVIDANRILAKGQKDFFFGPRVYYRIYAERRHASQSEESLALLLRNGIVDFYAPAFYWATVLPDKYIAKILADLYLYPTNRHGHNLMRIGLLLGEDFCKWLFTKWQARWKDHPQPPSFYWTLKQMMKEMEDINPLLLSGRFSLTRSIEIEGEKPVIVKDILEKPDHAANLVSKACMKVFQGDKDYTSTARDLDCLAYGQEIQNRASAISKGVIEIVGDRKAGDIVESKEPEE